MLNIPTITTDRLTMELLEHRHSPGMFDLWSSQDVCSYSGPAQDLAGDPIRLPALEPADSDKILEFFLHHANQGTAFRWALRKSHGGDFIGAIGFNSLGSCCEIAYHMRPRYWGHGYMSEACRAAMAWAFEEYGASSVEAHIEPENVRSIRLAERIGMTGTPDFESGARRYVLNAGDA